MPQLTNKTILALDPDVCIQSGNIFSREGDGRKKRSVVCDQYPQLLDARSINDLDDIAPNSIAVHNLVGSITYDGWSYYGDNTSEFIRDLKIAEDNPSIVGHLIYVDSPGGEAFGCHEAFLAVKALHKKCISFVDSVGCSAAYWLACAADSVYVRSIFSITGSIGAMIMMWDDSEYMKNEGFKTIKLYSKYSGLKNKDTDDALSGKPDDLIANAIDPIALQFLTDVKSVRQVKDDSEALQGRAYYNASGAMGESLIDGVTDLEDVIAQLTVKAAQPMIDLNTLNIKL